MAFDAVRKVPGARVTRCCAVLFFLPLGCRHGELSANQGSVSPSPAHSSQQEYPLRGTVVSVSADGDAVSQAVLKHEAIPGLMGAMTMAYPVDRAVRGELHPGDRLTARVLVNRQGGAISIAGLKDVVVLEQAQPDYRPAAQYHVPAAGDEVPDFALRNQSGKTLHLAQFKGKVLLLTFIYTRCPLADFCPRMSRDFADLDKALSADPKLYAGTHLLSASFDPSYDTPAVLRSYGGAYTGRYTGETFAHWDFAAPSEAELGRIEQWFDLGVTSTVAPDGKAALQHSVSTLVIGKDGKVFAFYPTNNWTVSQVLAQVRQAAAA